MKKVLSVKWSSKENALLYSYPCKPDGGMLASAFEQDKLLLGKSLVDELVSRGYDLTTLRFKINKNEQSNI
jgi:hypothetical protein